MQCTNTVSELFWLYEKASQNRSQYLTYKVFSPERKRKHSTVRRKYEIQSVGKHFNSPSALSGNWQLSPCLTASVNKSDWRDTNWTRMGSLIIRQNKLRSCLIDGYWRCHVNICTYKIFLLRVFHTFFLKTLWIEII